MSKPTCCGEVVLNSVAGKDFWYCRGCKKEVFNNNLIEVSDQPSTISDPVFSQILSFSNVINPNLSMFFLVTDFVIVPQNVVTNYSLCLNNSLK